MGAAITAITRRLVESYCDNKSMVVLLLTAVGTRGPVCYVQVRLENDILVLVLVEHVGTQWRSIVVV